jgi:hypothetical protein
MSGSFVVRTAAVAVGVNADNVLACAGSQHVQTRAYTPVSSSYRHQSPGSDRANGYDSDGIFNGPPATSAAHHSSRTGGGRSGVPKEASGGSRAPRSSSYGGIPAAPEPSGGSGFAGFEDGALAASAMHRGVLEQWPYLVLLAAWCPSAAVTECSCTRSSCR